MWDEMRWGCAVPISLVAQDDDVCVVLCTCHFAKEFMKNSSTFILVCILVLQMEKLVYLNIKCEDIVHM